MLGCPCTKLLQIRTVAGIAINGYPISCCKRPILRVGVWPIMGWPLPLPIWSINYIHFKHNIFKNEQFLSSSFEMAHICILLVIKIVLKSAKIDYSKIQMCAILKLLDKNGSFLDILTLKCIGLIDQE